MDIKNSFKNMFASSPKKEEFKPIKYDHTSGKKTYIFNVPGIAPNTIKIKNQERKILIYITPENKVYGYITTFDQIDKTEVNAKYQFGQIIVTIEPNEAKNKPYDIELVT